MITRIYSVFDSKAACFGTPFFMPKDAMAVRAFGDLANDSKSTIFQHPEDYQLFYLGAVDDESGSIVAEKPVVVVTASNLKRPTVSDALVRSREVVS